MKGEHGVLISSCNKFPQWTKLTRDPQIIHNIACESSRNKITHTGLGISQKEEFYAINKA